jgi:hypothetical protein
MACCILIASLMSRGLRALRRRRDDDPGAWRLHADSPGAAR